jgi:hypothetical protein
VGASGSPKDFARAVGDGFIMLTVTSLRKYQTPEQLRELLNNLTVVERETRNEVISEDDFEGNRKKHFRLGNLRKAKLVVQGFAKSRRIHL